MTGDFWVRCNEIPVVFRALPPGRNQEPDFTLKSKSPARVGGSPFVPNVGESGDIFSFGRIHCDRTPPQIRADRTRWLRSVGSAHGVSNVSDLQTLRTAVQQQKTQNGVDIARIEMSHAEGTIRLICCRPPFGCQRPDKARDEREDL
jgi:hypothetical protein